MYFYTNMDLVSLVDNRESYKGNWGQDVEIYQEAVCLIREIRKKLILKNVITVCLPIKTKDYEILKFMLRLRTVQLKMNGYRLGTSIWHVDITAGFSRLLKSK